MRVLVTGTTGFVGGAIARHLARLGHEVVGVSRGLSTTLPESVQQVQADIGAPTFVDDLVRTVAPCHGVVHAAASRNTRLDAPEVTLANCLGTQQVLSVARRWPVECFLFISGVTVIGKPCELPIGEEHTTAPRTAYHASKLYGEHLVEIARGEGRPAVSLRLTAPVGPGMPEGRILSIFIRRAVAGAPIELNGRGTRRQNYVDVRDVAAAVEQCVSQRPEGVFNIGGSETISNRQLAETCIKLLESASQITFSGRPDPEDGIAWDVCLEKARRIFGYRPRFSIEDTIRDLAEELRHK